MGWEWTNCGARPELVYFDQYHKALRIAYLVARRQDPHARVYISLTQWPPPPPILPTANPVARCSMTSPPFSAAEGDFAVGHRLPPLSRLPLRAQELA